MAVPYVKHNTVASQVSVEDALFEQARNFSTAEFQEYCSSLVPLLKSNNRGSDFTNALRQFFVLLETTRKNLPVPKQLIDQLYMVLSEPEQGPTRVRLLCSAILRELAPTTDLAIRHFNPPVEARQIPFILPVVLAQGSKCGFLDQMTVLLIKWLTQAGVDLENCQRAFTSLAVICCRHRELLTNEHIGLVSGQLARWLRDASTISAPNPFAGRQLFAGSKQAVPVKEVDGSASRDFFTVLSIGQFYSADQWLNIQSFSFLRLWLHRTFPHQQASSGHSRQPSVPLSYPASTATSRTPSPSLSISSTDDVATAAREKALAALPLGKSLGRLRDKACDYCLRIIDQCDRKPEKKSDEEMMNACLVEAVLTLDELCFINASLIPRLFPTVKRLYGRLTSSISLSASTSQPTASLSSIGAHLPVYSSGESRLLLVLVKFFLHHGEAVVYDPEAACTMFFGTILSSHYKIPSVAFETILLCLEHREHFMAHTSIFTRFFPNLLKVLAWSPRTFMSDFVEILPFMIQPSTVLEMLHSLLDLPCLAAGLEVVNYIQRLGQTEADAKKAFTAMPHQIAAITAYFNPQQRPLFNYLLRAEGGQGDTISRMPELYKLLDDLSSLPRVQICSQLAPLLVNLLLKTVLLHRDVQLLSQLFPLLCERISQLFNVGTFQQETQRILADHLLAFFKVRPQLLLDNMAEIIEFLSALRNISQGGEEFFSHLIWVVGEYSSPVHDSRITIDIINKLHDVLESMAYEAISAFQSTGSRPVASARLLCVLMTALAKIASRSQDLIPRVLLCLTKIVKQYAESQANQDNRQLMVSRANELVNLLKMPSVAATVLNPSARSEDGRLHSDGVSSIGLLLQGTSISVQ